MSPNLSIIILTHNDEERIVDCIESCLFADEIIVVDDESSDRTVEIAKQYTKNVYIRSLRRDFGTQRNFALERAHSNWILFVDSDERVSEFLQQEIKNAIVSDEYSGYYLQRVDYMWGRNMMHGDVGGAKLMRLARKGSGKWHGKVHEVWRVRGKTSVLSNSLIHVPHSTMHEFIQDIDEYTTVRTEELLKNKMTVSFISILIYPVIKFLLNYIIKKGYKDGVAGFVHAMIMSFHSFLVRGKLYLDNKA